MDKATAQMLNRLTCAFYCGNAASFSHTRKAPWKGWERLLEVLGPQLKTRERLRVLDLACGNLRFERYLADMLHPVLLEVHAYDSTPELCRDAGAIPGAHIDFEAVDLISCLLDEESLSGRLPSPTCDLSAAFGFLHHVPGFENRIELMRFLVDSTKPGGYIAVSFWQFMEDARLADKARQVTARACAEYGRLELEEHDYVLGWQDRAGAYRYCHHFTPDETDALCARLAERAERVAEFEADGKSGRLNRYIVWKRR